MASSPLLNDCCIHFFHEQSLEFSSSVFKEGRITSTVIIVCMSFHIWQAAPFVCAKDFGLKSTWRKQNMKICSNIQERSRWIFHIEGKILVLQQECSSQSLKWWGDNMKIVPKIPIRNCYVTLDIVFQQLVLSGIGGVSSTKKCRNC